MSEFLLPGIYWTKGIRGIFVDFSERENKGEKVKQVKDGFYVAEWENLLWSMGSRESLTLD